MLKKGFIIVWDIIWFNKEFEKCFELIVLVLSFGFIGIYLI